MFYIGAIIGIVSVLIVDFLISFIYAYVRVKKGFYRDCFCNDCKRNFSLEDYGYCPYCGKKLEHHVDDLVSYD